MNNTQRRAALTVLAAALVTTVLQGSAAATQQADKPVGIRATTINVVATGLNTPRGVIFDRGRVLVAEAGLGGPSAPNGGICGHANGGALYCYGETGSVFQYRENSGGTRIATGLASIANYNAAGDVRRSVLGLHDLSLYNGQLRGIWGLSGRQLPFRDQELVPGAPGAIVLGQAATINGNQVTPFGDLAAYEETNNPHTENPYGGPIIDSDPYGMYTDAAGTAVADAAGNDLLLVQPNGNIQVLQVFPNRQPAPQPDDINWNIEPVPSTVVRGPDGAYYVGELTGFPYYRDEAKVWRVVPGQAPTLVAGGFTNIADITFDDRGRLVVLEMSREGLYANREVIGGGQVPAHNGDTVTGRLVRVERDGSQTTLASTGLSNPGGVAFASTESGVSTYYVTNKTTSADGSGELLRVTVRG